MIKLNKVISTKKNHSSFEYPSVSEFPKVVPYVFAKIEKYVAVSSVFRL